VTHGYDLLYNKIAASKILFSDDVANKFIDFLRIAKGEKNKAGEYFDTESLDMTIALEMIERDKEKIYAERDYFMEIQERDIYWYKGKYNFKDYGVL
jgi:hypothetical protein